MKLNEILSESDINEFIGSNPTSGIGAGLTALGAKMGFKKAQAGQDVNRRADQLYQSFQSWALRSGKDMTQVLPTDLTSWLGKQGLPAPSNYGVPTSPYNLNDRGIASKVFKAIATSAFEQGTQSGPTLGQQYGIQGAAGGPTGAPPPTPSMSVNDLITALSTTPLTPGQKARLQTLLGTP